MHAEEIAIITVVLFVVILIADIVAWGFAAVYMFKTLTNYHQQREWRKFLPILFFMLGFLQKKVANSALSY